MPRSDRLWLFSALALTLAAAMIGRAQERPAPAAPADPRIGLKAGVRDAGVAARNLELVASLPKPEGFFDPGAPAGVPEAPERGGGAAASAPAPAGTAAPAPPTTTPAEATPPSGTETPAAPVSGRGSRPPGDLSFANSDLSFGGDALFSGNFHGFNAYTIEDPRRPRLLASVVCPGGQGDVSVYGALLFMSVEQTRGRIDCGTGGVQGRVSAERFRGVRIFDVSDLRSPRQIAAVQTCRGSHTHTLVVDPKDTANVYIYGSGTSSARSAEELAGCSGLKPEEDPNTALYSIDVIQVPLAAPATARVVNRPRIFADAKTGAIAGLWQGGSHGTGLQTTSATTHCHDITVFAEIGLAAGACAGNGILLDITDPVNPVRIDQVTDTHFAYWHSATFNNDGTKVIFTDEWGGGTRARCRASDLPTWGANAVFDIVDRKLRFGSYYKLPAAQSEQENCVAHNGSIIPVPGRDIMVQGWYQGGISVFDFTDSSKPVEIAFFDRGPIDAARLITAGYWAAYWYNGHIYGAEMSRGLDVFRLLPSEHLTRNEIDAAMRVHSRDFNPQRQTRLAWPAATVVARAYLDQLARTKGIEPKRAEAVRTALDRVDRLKTGKERGASELLQQVDSLAGELERAAVGASGQDAKRLQLLASTIKGRIAELRP